MYADGARLEALKVEHPKFFDEPRNIILGGCGDGVSPFDKPTKELSMMCFVFNVFNLPQQIRDKYDNLQLWGIYDGKHDLHGVVHGILVKDLEVMFQGVDVWDAWTEATFNLRAIPLFFLADLPGHFDLTNSKSVGSYAGCSKCRYIGQQCPALGNMVYVDSKQPVLPVDLRTHEGMKDDAQRADVRKALSLYFIRLPSSNAHPIRWRAWKHETYDTY